MESRFQNTELTNNPENSYQCSYNKRSKVLNTFLFLFSAKILVYRDRTHKILVRTANREDPLIRLLLKKYQLYVFFRVCTVCLGLSGVQNLSSGAKCSTDRGQG